MQQRSRDLKYVTKALRGLKEAYYSCCTPKKPPKHPEPPPKESIYIENPSPPAKPPANQPSSGTQKSKQPGLRSWSPQCSIYVPVTKVRRKTPSDRALKSSPRMTSMEPRYERSTTPAKPGQQSPCHSTAGVHQAASLGNRTGEKKYLKGTTGI